MLQVDLQLGVGDSVRVYDGLGERAERLLQSLSHHNNHRRALLESSQGQMSIFYRAKPHSPGHGFNATYQVANSWWFVHFPLICSPFCIDIVCFVWYQYSVKLSFKTLLKAWFSSYEDIIKLVVFVLTSLGKKILKGVNTSIHQGHITLI